MRWLIALILVLAAPAWVCAEEVQAPKLIRAITASPIWLNTSRPVTAEDLRGRVVLLDFWTLGCINCMDIMPDLTALEREFGNSLTLIGVHSAKFSGEKDLNTLKSAISRYGITHPVVSDADFSIWNAFGVRAWPTLVLLDPDGKVASVYAGEGNRAALERDIRALIEKYKGTLVTAALPLATTKETSADLRFPGKIIAMDISHLIVADSGHNRIIVTDIAGKAEQVIGSGMEGLKDGSFEQAQFSKPQGLAYKDGAIYVADRGNHALRLIDLKQHSVSTLAGTGGQGRFLDSSAAQSARKTALSSPWDIAFFPDDYHLAIAMAGVHQLWLYDIAHGTLQLLAGNGQESLDDGHAPFNALAQPSGLFALGDKLYFTDAESSSLRVYDAKDATVATLIGKGLFDFGYKEGGLSDALMQHCSGLTGDDGNLYIADTYNHSIRRYDIIKATLSNYAGHDAEGNADGALATASFNAPGGITKLADILYVADTDNHHVRAISMKEGAVTTLGDANHFVIAPQSGVVSPAPSPLPVIASPAATAAIAPNLAEALSLHVAAAVPIDVMLALQPGWHVNALANSELSLNSGVNGEIPLLGFDRDTLRSGRFSLPRLQAKRAYTLSGMIYYCADSAGSLCMIKSFDIKLTPDGKDTKLTLPVN